MHVELVVLGFAFAAFTVGSFIHLRHLRDIEAQRPLDNWERFLKARYTAARYVGPPVSLLAILTGLFG